MALRPEDIALSSEEKEEASKLEKHLDEGLKNSFFPQSGKPIMLVVGNYSARVLNEVIIRYKKAGWSKVEQANGYMAFSK